MLSTNPVNTSRLRLHAEEREINEKLRFASYGKTPIKSRVATRPRDIQQAMLDFNPQIVHFSGHGSEQDGLVFEDATGEAKLVSSEALASLFKIKIFSNQVECVVLNACYSKFQAEAIAQHINYVVGMSKAISDRAAIEFAVGFYSALGAGQSIEVAYEMGCNAIQLEGFPEHLTPVLYIKGKLLQFNFGNSEQDKETSQATVRGRFDTDVIAATSTDQPLKISVTAPQTISSQTAQHLEAQSFARKDEIILDLINKLFDALSSPNVEVGIQKFEAIAHKSLFQNGQINPAFRKNNFSVAFTKENLYKRPIEIIDSQFTGRTRLGLRADKEDGKEEKYAIARNDNFKGLYHVRIFFPADGRAAKISGLSL